MRTLLNAALLAPVCGILFVNTALAEWTYSGPPYPNATIQTNSIVHGDWKGLQCLQHFLAAP